MYTDTQTSYRTGESIWKSWKPYAAIAAALTAGVWWYHSLSSLATPKDGQYNCYEVYVADSGKYQLPPTSGKATAIVRSGEVVSISAPEELPEEVLASLTVRSKGTSHFHVSDDPAPHSYYALACDHASG